MDGDTYVSPTGEFRIRAPSCPSWAARSRTAIRLSPSTTTSAPTSASPASTSTPPSAGNSKRGACATTCCIFHRHRAGEFPDPLSRARPSRARATCPTWPAARSSPTPCCPNGSNFGHGAAGCPGARPERPGRRQARLAALRPPPPRLRPSARRRAERVTAAQHLQLDGQAGGRPVVTPASPRRCRAHDLPRRQAALALTAYRGLRGQPGTISTLTR